MCIFYVTNNFYGVIVILNILGEEEDMDMAKRGRGFDSMRSIKYFMIFFSNILGLYVKNYCRGFTFGKRNFDEIDRARFSAFAKRNFDELDRAGFGAFHKRNFDELDRAGFGAFHKRNFDELDRNGFGAFNRYF